MAESRRELDLNGGPMETEYRAFGGHGGFKPEPSARSGILRYRSCTRRCLKIARWWRKNAPRADSATSGCMNRFSNSI